MCIFSTLIIWGLLFKVQTSFEAQNFMLLLSFSLHSFSLTFKLLSMASYGGEFLLDSSFLWSGVSNYLSSRGSNIPTLGKTPSTTTLDVSTYSMKLQESIEEDYFKVSNKLKTTLSYLNLRVILPSLTVRQMTLVILRRGGGGGWIKIQRLFPN